jgi:hypothetical protein
MPPCNPSNILECWVNELSSLLSVAKKLEDKVWLTRRIEPFGCSVQAPNTHQRGKGPDLWDAERGKVGAKWGALLRSAHLLSEHFSR